MADTKTTGLDAATTLADTDVIYAVDNVATSATSKKITIANVKTVINAGDLHLDQTTPQTIINGIPLLESTHADFTDQHQIIDKKYVDEATATIGTRFYMLDAADGDVAAYKSTSLTASALSSANVSASADAETDTLIEEWISPTGITWTTLQYGVYDFNCFVEKTAGNRDVRVFWRFYERKEDTSEVLIATSNLGDLVTDKERQRIYATLSSNYTPSENSRLVGKVYMQTTGGSQNTTCVLYYQGDEDSHWQIPVSQEFLDDRYLQLAGGTMTGDILGAISLGVTGTRLTKGWFTDLEVTNAIAGSITGTAAKATILETTRAIYGNNFNGSAALTQVIASTYGGTGNGFTKFTGPATAERTFTLPNSDATLLYSGGDAGTPSALVGTNISGTAASLTAGAVTGFTPASGSLTLAGADAVTLTTTAATNVTLPTSGTLAVNNQTF